MKAIRVKELLDAMNDNQRIVLVDTILKKESLPTKTMYARNKEVLDRDVIRIGKEKDIIGYEVIVICY